MYRKNINDFFKERLRDECKATYRKANSVKKIWNYLNKLNINNKEQCKINRGFVTSLKYIFAAYCEEFFRVIDKSAESFQKYLRVIYIEV